MEKVLDRLVRGNPHNDGSWQAIGPSQGMVLSDIRLHMRVALRRKNPHVFRPDLLAERPAPPSAAQLQALSESEAVFILRFAGAPPFFEMRHLTFMDHLTDAMAEIAQCPVLYDLVLEALYTPSEYHAILTANKRHRIHDLHLRVDWVPATSGGIVRTWGLQKVGLPELETAPLPSDQQVLSTAALEHFAREMMEARLIDEQSTLPLEAEVSVYDHPLILKIEPNRRGPQIVRIFHHTSL